MSHPHDTATMMTPPAAENRRPDVPAGILVTTRPTNPLAAQMARELFAGRERRPIPAPGPHDERGRAPATPAPAFEPTAQQLFRTLTDAGEYPLGSVLAPVCSAQQVTEAVRAAIQRAEEPR